MPASKQLILMVEDHPPNILVVSHLLEELGYAHDIAHDGHEAVKKFTNSKYAAILMDIQLPELDGMSASRQIRRLEEEKNSPRTPIIAMTGRATAEDKFLCHQAGIDDVLSKPFKIEELDTALQRVLLP